MLDLADQVRTELRAAVDDLSPSPRLDGLVRRRMRQRERRRRFAAAGVVAAMVGAATVGVLVLQSGGDPPSVVAGSGASADQSGGALFLVPDPVPGGFALLRVSGGDQPGVGTDVSLAPEWDRTQRLVRFDSAGERPEEVIDVQWGPGPSPAEPSPASPDLTDPLAAYRAEPDALAVTVRGHEGLSSAAGGWLVWEEPAGQVVLVAGEVAPAGSDRAVGGPLDPALIGTVADALVPREGGGFDLPTPPDGFEPVAEWPGVASEGTNPRAVVYEAADGRTVQVHVADDSEIPPGVSLGASDARRVDVRGSDAVLTPRLVSAPGEIDEQTHALAAADLFVQWTDPGGAQVTVSGVGLDEPQILAVARSLVAVDEDTWFSLVPYGEDDPEVRARAAPDATPPTSAPDQAAPPPGDAPRAGDVHVEGSYAGTEHYGFTAGACPDLDHTLDSTFELDDGTVWQYHSEYCGELDGDLWTGSGTFAFTTPDGDTITGTKDVEATEIPSPGVPVVLVITGGSGPYDGASGSCELDNHVTQVQIGVQEQYGTFTCDFTP